MQYEIGDPSGGKKFRLESKCGYRWHCPEGGEQERERTLDETDSEWPGKEKQETKVPMRRCCSKCHGQQEGKPSKDGRISVGCHRTTGEFGERERERDPFQGAQRSETVGGHLVLSWGINKGGASPGEPVNMYKTEYVKLLREIGLSREGKRWGLDRYSSVERKLFVVFLLQPKGF